MNYPVSAQNNISDITSVPEVFMAHLAASKLENKSNYQIDDIDVREFAGECWKLLSPEERKHYRNQLDNPEIDPSGPSIKKLAFDLNRGLQSAYDEASKNKSDINDELDAQVSNFKYLNLSNSDLHKKDNLGLFANADFQNRVPFKDKDLLPATIESALATFPSAERLGYVEEGDKDKFVNATAAILEGVSMTKDNKGNRANDNTITPNMGALDGHLTSAVAIYVDKNFKDLQDLTKDEQIAIGEAFKEEYKKLHAEQENFNKKNKLVGSVPLKKLDDAFERVTVEKRLLKSEDKFVSVDIDNTPSPKDPPRSPSPIMDFMRKMVSSPQTTAPLARPSAVKPIGSKSTGNTRH